MGGWVHDNRWLIMGLICSALALIGLLGYLT